MSRFQIFIISRCIEIYSQVRLQRCPDICYKKFAEPITITAFIALMTVCKKDGQWTISDRQNFIVSIWLYTLITGFEAPIVRASIMATIAFWFEPRHR